MKGKKKSIRQCLSIIFSEDLKAGDEFSGLWLHDKVAALNEDYKWTYPDSILRTARLYYRNLFKVVNRRKSIYERIGD